MSQPYDAYDYDDPRYVQVSQKCEICGDWWDDDRILKSWSRHPNVTVHEECDVHPVEKKQKIDDCDRVKKILDAIPKEKLKKYEAEFLKSEKGQSELVKFIDTYSGDI